MAKIEVELSFKEKLGEFFKGIQTGVFGEMAGKGGAGGAGIFGNILGKLGLLSGVFLAVKEIASKIYAKLKEASPALQAVSSMFEQSIRLFFKPFGDFLAMLLRPLAVWLLRIAVKWYKWLSGMTEEQKKKAATGALAGTAVAGPIGGIIGGVIGANWKEILEKIAEFFYSIIEKIVDWQNSVKEFAENVKQKIIDWWDSLGAYWVELAANIAYFWEDLKANLANKWDEVKAKFNGWILDLLASWDALKSELADKWKTIIGKFLEWKDYFVEKWNELKSSLANAWDKIKSAIRGFLDWIEEKIRSVYSSAVKTVKGVLGVKQGGGYIAETGAYLLHAGEYVVPRGSKVGQMTEFNYSPTINVNANISSEMDIRDLAEKIARYSRDRMRRYTMYGI